MTNVTYDNIKDETIRRLAKQLVAECEKRNVDVFVGVASTENIGPNYMGFGFLKPSSLDQLTACFEETIKESCGCDECCPPAKREMVQ